MSSIKCEGLVLSILASCLPPLLVLALGVQPAGADTWQISAGDRNAWDDSFSGSINLCDFGDAFWQDSCGLAWAVTIPPKAKILSAKVRAYSNNHVGNAGAYTARIRVEDVDSAAVFTGAPNNVQGRTYWSTTIDWSIPAGGLPFPAWSESPDITNLIQHIVDRSGWASGNFINIAIWGQTNAGGGGAFENISPFPTNPAELVVTYLPLQPLYRSVGTTATNLNTGGRTVQIAGSTATFSGPMPDNVGVGDVLTYVSGGNQLAFIHGRTSSTEFTVQDKTGGTPIAASGGTAVGVYRAYNSLTNWESRIENPNITEPIENDVNPATDLVSSNTVMMVACYGDGPDTASTYLDSWTTGPANYIKIYTPTSLSEVGTSQRHTGTWNTSAYRISQNGSYFAPLGILERYVRIEGLQIDSNLVVSNESNGIQVMDGNGDAEVEIHISNNIFRMTAAPPGNVAYGIGATNGFGDITLNNSLYVVKVWNNIIFGYTASVSSSCMYGQDYGTVYAYNNTCVGGSGSANGFIRYNNVDFYAKNNISIDSADPYAGTFRPESTDNVSDIGDAPGANPVNGEPTFVNKPGNDYHLNSSDTVAKDAGIDLSADPSLAVFADIDRGARVVPWDIGADDTLATTEVELLSFEARALDGAVELSWETGSELKNLGFNVHRGPSAEGPWTRLTATLIPGLGSSPEGARYLYRDSPLSNGTMWFYLLEDVETTGRTERHGPIEATSTAQASVADEALPPAVTIFGDPQATVLRVLSQSASEMRIELLTGGFQAFPKDDGTVDIEIPGFTPSKPSKEAPGLPVKLHWIDAVAGRKVDVVSVRAAEVQELGLVPSQSPGQELEASWDGTQRLRRSRGSTLSPASNGLVPEEAARIVEVAFQGEAKKALLELAPLRWDSSTGRLLFARSLQVTLRFQGRERTETTWANGRRGRREREIASSRGIVARLAAVDRGLYAVRYEDVYGKTRRGVDAKKLRLSRLGNPVSFHLEPPTSRFAPGSTLYFVSEGAEANPYGNEAVYELESGRPGEHMPIASAAPAGKPLVESWASSDFEEDRYYQAGLLEAPDLWLWDVIPSPSVKSFPFSVSSLGSMNGDAKLEVWLQGASDFPESPDHHARVFVNGTLVGEDSWDGKAPRRLERALPVGVVREGENSLEIENVGDTGALYSMFFLDRFGVGYARLAIASDGVALGTWFESGTAEVSDIGADARVLDVTEPAPQWLNGVRHEGEVLRFRVEEGRTYLAVDPSSVRRPEIRRASPVLWKQESFGGDYVAVGPRELLDAARPLLDHRRRQGFRVAAVSIDEVFDEMGYGERRPEALRDFLTYAYHHWPGGVRHVLLLGDASYDFKDHLGTGAPNRVPALAIQTSYLWTASDPSLAAVNGDDLLPDVAIGRLPAADAAELRVMIDKILDYEAGGLAGLSAPVVLVTDNPDEAGDFDADARDLMTSVLASRTVRHISLTALGAGPTRDAILSTYDEGASVVSYMGHGGIHLWASENVFNNDSVTLLAPQSRQPLTITLDCLNGYFAFPNFDSLAEELLKADAKGAIAVFAPSGLSLNEPAHALHKVLLEQIFGGRHARLGDAWLAAQAKFLQSGSYAELLAIYHLFGDPALPLR